MIVSTTLIVLDKSAYRESALLIHGISPDCGKLSLVAHRAQQVSEKSFPVADLFRELEVEFKDNVQGTLFSADKIELGTDFDGIAQTPNAFKLAGRIGSFLLKNSAENVGLPYTYDTLRSVFSHLAAPNEHGAWTLEQCSVVIKTAFLYENGLLPEEKNDRQGEFMENLVAAGIENSELPECPPKYWNKLNLWLNALIAYHQLKR